MTLHADASANSSDETPSPVAVVPAADTNTTAALTNRPPFGRPDRADAYPYWIPPGLNIDGWPPHIRAHVAAVINPEYEELVLNAKPGVGRQMALSLLHLGWLEILDHLRLGRLVPAPAAADPEEVLGIESRQTVIARHLRLVNAKLKISQFLLRLDEFKATCRPRPDRELPSDDALLSAHRAIHPTKLVHFVMENGKDDVC